MNYLHTRGQDQLVHLHDFRHKRCQTTSFLKKIDQNLLYTT